MVFISPEPNRATSPFLFVGNGKRPLHAFLVVLHEVACEYSKKTSRVIPEFDAVTSKTRCCTNTPLVMIQYVVNLSLLLTFYLHCMKFFHILLYCELDFNVF